MSSVFDELKHKVFRSGNPAYLYIGINVLIFLLVGLVNLLFFLSGKGTLEVDALIRIYFGYPANLGLLPYRFYTILTYQFFHDGIFHILFNMLWLFWMGNIFLDFLKPRQFHFVYLAGGVAGALLYTLVFNVFPVFAGSLPSATLLGSSAAVMAIVVATATLVPDYGMSLMFFGNVKLKYLAIAYVALDLISIASANAGGSLAHLGGAILGFSYIKLLQNGTDWSNLFKRKPKLKVVKNNGPSRTSGRNNANSVDQREVDAILDKISKFGYEKLSKEEKETLFKASKH